MGKQIIRCDFYNETEKSLWEMYDQMCIGDCITCKECREKNKQDHFSRPVSAWYVGSKMKNHVVRLMFVGKNARGFFFEDDILESHRGVAEGINNAFSSRFDLHEKGWAYWNYTREIVCALYGDDSPEHVAVTNMVKCNNSEGKDTTSDDMKVRCIRYLKIVNKEAKIINPTHIIFYTGWDYDRYIDDVFDEVIEPGDKNMRKAIGKHSAPWREGIGKINGNEVYFLRTCHPERKKKKDFISCIYNWIVAKR